MRKIQKNVLLASYTTFKIGGPARYFAEARNIEEVQEFCSWAKKRNLSIFVLGGGSNVLISDKGFNGLVIKIKNLPARNAMQSVAGGKLKIWTGALLSQLVLETIQRGLSGLEWAIGIPGTVGGAIVGNTGAFGKETADCIDTITILDCDDFSLRYFQKEHCDFGYRYSIFKENKDFVILEAVLNFKKDSSVLIQKRIKEYKKQRLDSFSSGYNCAGCFFKNIEWKNPGINKEKILKDFPELKKFSDKPKISAGFLIDFLGLKGKTIGPVKVSDGHANFILNTKGATAEQILMLSGLIKDKIYSHYGFNLEEEINLVGF